MDLIDAVNDGDIIRVRELLDRGANPNKVDTIYGDTALIKASYRGHTEIVRLLLDHGADPNFRLGEDMPPLIMATLWNHIEIADLLLDNGADPNIRDHNGYTALFWAKRKKNYDIATLIRDHIHLQKARQRLAFTTFLLGDDDDLDQDVVSRILGVTPGYYPDVINRMHRERMQLIEQRRLAEEMENTIIADYVNDLNLDQYGSGRRRRSSSKRRKRKNYTRRRSFF